MGTGGPSSQSIPTLWDGIKAIFYIKSHLASNSKKIIAPWKPDVKRKVGDPYRIRTDVNGVRGRCLNHLTNGPFGTPAGTRTQDPLIKSQLLYQLSYRCIFRGFSAPSKLNIAFFCILRTTLSLLLDQAFGLLVSVSLMHYCTYTPDLSTT